MTLRKSAPLYHLIFPVIAVTIGASSARAVTKEVTDLRGCYLAYATMYGLSNCDPPPMLIPAVYGKCEKEESDLNAFFIKSGLKMYPSMNQYEAANAAAIAMTKFKKSIDPQIQSWILDAQISTGQCSGHDGPQSGEDR